MAGLRKSEPAEPASSCAGSVPGADFTVLGGAARGAAASQEEAELLALNDQFLAQSLGVGTEGATATEGGTDAEGPPPTLHETGSGEWAEGHVGAQFFDTDEAMARRMQVPHSLTPGKSSSGKS